MQSGIFSAPYIEAVHDAIAPFVHRTPVLTSSYLNQLSGAKLFFKCENFQKIGAFKARGATNAVLELLKRGSVSGVCTHSSGNHAQAVALAAKLNGLKATIVMPSNAPKVKLDAVASLGAEIVLCEPTIQARTETTNKLIDEKHYAFIHPYDNDHVIAGQATCAKELLEEIPDLEILICPVGGGGLLAGTLLSNAFFGSAKVYAAEPEMVNDAFISFKTGERQPATNKPTVADGLKTDLGERNFRIMNQYLTDIFTVSENEIIAAMRLIWERMKIIIEPSCAVPLAAVLKHASVFQNKRVGIILTGGNVDLDHLPFNH